MAKILKESRRKVLSNRLIAISISVLSELITSISVQLLIIHLKFDEISSSRDGSFLKFDEISSSRDGSFLGVV